MCPGLQSLSITEICVSAGKEALKRELNLKAPRHFSMRSKTRRTEPLIQWFMRKARKLFSSAKNKVRRVFLDSCKGCTISISTKDESPSEKKSEYSLFLKTDLSIIWVLWHFLCLKFALRLSFMFDAGKGAHILPMQLLLSQVYACY